MFLSFWNETDGAIVSIEIVLIVTIAVLALIVGWSEVAKGVNTELNDISNAIGALNQGYAYTGYESGRKWHDEKQMSRYNGSRFEDSTDDCDLNSSCDLVCSTHHIPASER